MTYMNMQVSCAVTTYMYVSCAVMTYMHMQVSCVVMTYMYMQVSCAVMTYMWVSCAPMAQVNLRIGSDVTDMTGYGSYIYVVQ